MSKLTKNNVEHYKWGNNCDAWKYVKNNNLSIIVERIPVNSCESSHFHRKAKQFFYIQKGQAKIFVNQKEYILNANEGIEIENYSVHSIYNNGISDLEFLLVSTPKSHGDRVDVNYMIRNARIDDISKLSELAILSKSLWDYPKDWLELWKKELTMTTGSIKKSTTIVADLNGKIIGFWYRELIQTFEDSKVISDRKMPILRLCLKK